MVRDKLDHRCEGAHYLVSVYCPPIDSFTRHSIRRNTSCSERLYYPKVSNLYWQINEGLGNLVLGLAAI